MPEDDIEETTELVLVAAELFASRHLGEPERCVV